MHILFNHGVCTKKPTVGLAETFFSVARFSCDHILAGLVGDPGALGSWRGLCLWGTMGFLTEILWFTENEHILEMLRVRFQRKPQDVFHLLGLTHLVLAVLPHSYRLEF